MKYVNFLIIFLLVLTISACHKTDQVPDLQLKLLIDNEFYGSEAPYTYTATHNYDKQSNIDSVSVAVTQDYPYATFTYTNTFFFQYNRTSDNWIQLSDTGWSDSTAVYKQEKFTGKIKVENYLYDGSYYEININFIDFQTNSLSCDYYIYMPFFQAENKWELLQGSAIFESFPWKIEHGEYSVQILLDWNRGLLVHDSYFYD